VYQPEQKRPKKRKAYERTRWEKHLKNEIKVLSGLVGGNKEEGSEKASKRIKKGESGDAIFNETHGSLGSKKSNKQQSEQSSSSSRSRSPNTERGTRENEKYVPRMELDDYPLELINQFENTNEGAASQKKHTGPRMAYEFDFTNNQNMLEYENKFTPRLLANVWYKVRKGEQLCLNNYNAELESKLHPSTNTVPPLVKHSISQNLPTLESARESFYSFEFGNNTSSLIPPSILPPHLQPLTRLERLRFATLIKYSLINRKLPQYSIHTSMAHASEFYNSVKNLVMFMIRLFPFLSFFFFCGYCYCSSIFF
jgi:hypothetical protein